MDGTIKEEVKEFAGTDISPRAKGKVNEIREVDLSIVKYLTGKGLVFASDKYLHSYPHCWRCDTPLLNYATSSWFVAVTKIKAKSLELAKQIRWSPEHMKEGRFGKWLSGARDWSISAPGVIEEVQSRMSMKAPLMAEAATDAAGAASMADGEDSVDVTDVLKNRIDTIGLSTRTLNALTAANIRTVGGVARKHVADLLEIDGIGDKGITEIRDALGALGLSLKE
jgi:hypothetical protein